MKIIILCALRQEAVPLAKFLHLKKDLLHPRVLSWSGDHIHLATPNTVGPKAMAELTAWLIGHHNFPHLEDLYLINTGIAGCLPQELPIGEVTLIHQVREAHSKTAFIPDNPWRHPFTEKGLVTVPQPIDNEQPLPRNVNPDFPLVDMEGSGFASSCQRFLATHQWSIIKVVSDHLDFSSRSKEQLLQVWLNALPDIGSWIQNLSQTPSPGSEIRQQWLTWKNSQQHLASLSATLQERVRHRVWKAILEKQLHALKPLPRIRSEKEFLQWSDADKD